MVAETSSFFNEKKLFSYFLGNNSFLCERYRFSVIARLWLRVIVVISFFGPINNSWHQPKLQLV